MENAFNQNLHYLLLKTLSHQPDMSQRAIVRKIGFSLGKVNESLNQLIANGMVRKIKSDRKETTTAKIAFKYPLTVDGREEKNRLGTWLLERKLFQQKALKAEIQDLLQYLAETRDSEILKELNFVQNQRR